MPRDSDLKCNSESSYHGSRVQCKRHTNFELRLESLLETFDGVLWLAKSTNSDVKDGSS